MARGGHTESYFRPPTAEEIQTVANGRPPPLLDLDGNDDLAQAAYTRPTSVAPRSPLTERLEWRGDALLRIEISEMLYRRYPTATPGTLSVRTDFAATAARSQEEAQKLRAELVSNKTFVQLAKACGISARIRPPLSDAEQGLKAIANAFEAHFGVLKTQGRDDEARRWVEDVMAPLAGYLMAAMIPFVPRPRQQRAIAKRGIDAVDAPEEQRHAQDRCAYATRAHPDR